MPFLIILYNNRRVIDETIHHDQVHIIDALFLWD
jgi:hypothetical protein